MSTPQPPIILTTNWKWRLILIAITLFTSLILYARGNLFQPSTLPLSILLTFSGVIIVLTLLFLIESIRQEEIPRLRSPFFRLGFLILLLTLLAFMYFIEPIKIIDLIFLILQSFFLSGLVLSFFSKIILNEESFTLVSLLGRRTIKWKGISSIRWVDKSTISVLAEEYRKGVHIPLFTFKDSDLMLQFLANNTDPQRIDVHGFLKGWKNR